MGDKLAKAKGAIPAMVASTRCATSVEERAYGFLLLQEESRVGTQMVEEEERRGGISFFNC
jgi:hypothetical protein